MSSSVFTLVVRVILELVASEEALLQGLLGHMVRLSSHCRLIGHAGSLNKNAINWNVHAVLDLDDISDLDKTLVDVFLLSISDDVDDFGSFGLLLLLKELLLLVVVTPSGEQRHNSHGS